MATNTTASSKNVGYVFNTLLPIKHRSILDSQALKNFLLLNKCSFEITKQKIDNYYSVRSRVPDIAFEMNPKRPYFKEFKDMM